MAEQRMGDERQTSFEESVRLGYEVTDANTKGILIAAFSGLFIGISIFFGIWWLFNTFKREIRSTQVAPSHLRETDLVPPEPRLELNPHLDFAALRKEKLAILDSEGWVDRKDGWVHIPIEDAMRLLVREQNDTRKREGGQK